MTRERRQYANDLTVGKPRLLERFLRTLVDDLDTVDDSTALAIDSIMSHLGAIQQRLDDAGVAAGPETNNTLPILPRGPNNPDNPDGGAGDGPTPGKPVASMAMTLERAGGQPASSPLEIGRQGVIRSDTNYSLEFEKAARSEGYTPFIPLRLDGAGGETGEPQYAKIRRVNNLGDEPHPVNGEMRFKQLDNQGWIYSEDDDEWTMLAGGVAILGTSLLQINPLTQPPENYPGGTLVWDSGTQHLWIRELIFNLPGPNTEAWVPLTGVLDYSVLSKADLEAGLNGTPALAEDQAGFRFHDPVYRHTWRWAGTHWEFDYGDDGSAYLRWFERPPDPSEGWEPMNAVRTVSLSQSLATVVNISLPNIITSGPFIFGTPTYTGVTDDSPELAFELTPGAGLTLSAFGMLPYFRV